MLFSSRRLKELEERVAKLRRDLDDRDLDWVDMRARCKRLLDRTEKAARVLTTDSDGSGEKANSPNGEPGTGHLLTPRQLAVQQQILKRRGGV